MQAGLVAANLKRQLWDPVRGAMFARDAADEVVTTMVHDNLRMMWTGTRRGPFNSPQRGPTRFRLAPLTYAPYAPCGAYAW